MWRLLFFLTWFATKTSATSFATISATNKQFVEFAPVPLDVYFQGTCQTRGFVSCADNAIILEKDDVWVTFAQVSWQAGSQIAPQASILTGNDQLSQEVPFTFEADYMPFDQYYPDSVYYTEFATSPGTMSYPRSASFLTKGTVVKTWAQANPIVLRTAKDIKLDTNITAEVPGSLTFGAFALASPSFVQSFATPNSIACPSSCDVNPLFANPLTKGSHVVYDGTSFSVTQTGAYLVSFALAGIGDDINPLPFQLAFTQYACADSLLYPQNSRAAMWVNTTLYSGGDYVAKRSVMNLVLMQPEQTWRACSQSDSANFNVSAAANHSSITVAEITQPWVQYASTVGGTISITSSAVEMVGAPPWGNVQQGNDPTNVLTPTDNGRISVSADGFVLLMWELGILGGGVSGMGKIQTWAGKGGTCLSATDPCAYGYYQLLMPSSELTVITQSSALIPVTAGEFVSVYAYAYSPYGSIKNDFAEVQGSFGMKLSAIYYPNADLPTTSPTAAPQPAPTIPPTKSPSSSPSTAPVAAPTTSPSKSPVVTCTAIVMNND